VVDTKTNNTATTDLRTGMIAPDAQTSASKTQDDTKDRIAEMQRVLAFRLAALIATNPKTQEDLENIATLQAAHTSTNLTVLSLAYMGTVAAKGSVEGTQAQIAARNAIAVAEISSIYPDFAQYTPEAQTFISRQFSKYLEQSPTLRAANDNYNALPQDIKEATQERIESNREKWKTLSEHSVFNETETGKHAKKLINDYKLHSDSKFDELQQMIEKGASAADITRFVAGRIKEQIDIGTPVAMEVLKHQKSEVVDIFKKEYGYKPDTNTPPNMSAVMGDWNKISFKDRSAAIEAYEKAGGDMSKLSAEHQKTVALASIMLATEAANSLNAMSAMAKNVQLEATLRDKANDPDGKKRVEAVLDYMKNNSNVSADRSVRREYAQDLVALIDKDPTTLDLLKKGDEASMREIGNRMMQLQAAQRGITISSDKPLDYTTFAISYASEARDESAVRILQGDYSSLPAHIRNDPERLKNSVAWAEDWQSKARERESMLEANATPAELAQSEATTIMTDEQYKKNLDALRTAGMKFDGGASTQVASAATPEASTLAATEPTTQAVGASASAASSTSVVAATASPLPPGYPKDLPSLASLGVTGGTQPTVAEQQEPKGHLVSKTAAAAQEISGQAY